MDLSTIETPETVTVHIEHPRIGKLYSDDDRSKPVTVEVFSPASNQAVEYRRSATKRMSERMGRKGIKALSQIPPAELEEFEIEKLAAMTASVNNIEMNGVRVTRQNCADMYRNPQYGWLREQVAERIGSWEDFLA